MTLNSSCDREDSSQQLLVTAVAAGSWDAAEYEQYQFGDSEKGILPLISGRPGSQCPTCGSERMSAYMRQDSAILYTGCPQNIPLFPNLDNLAFYFGTPLRY